MVEILVKCTGTKICHSCMCCTCKICKKGNKKFYKENIDNENLKRCPLCRSYCFNFLVDMLCREVVESLGGV